MKNYKIVAIKKEPNKEKIHCEELTEKALKWFYERFNWQIEEDIINLYMTKFKIKEEDVNW
jgi:hypothetical protein